MPVLLLLTSCVHFRAHLPWLSWATHGCSPTWCAALTSDFEPLAFSSWPAFDIAVEPSPISHLKPGLLDSLAVLPPSHLSLTPHAFRLHSWALCHPCSPHCTAPGLSV